jgi:hypothetical protein
MALGFTTTVTVIVAGVPLDDGVTIDGLNAQLVPLGAPVHVNVIGSTNPFCPVKLTVMFADLPTATDSEFAERVASKSPIESWAVAERVATPFDRFTVKL